MLWCTKWGGGVGKTGQGFKFPFIVHFVVERVACAFLPPFRALSSITSLLPPLHAVTARVKLQK